MKTSDNRVQYTLTLEDVGDICAAIRLRAEACAENGETEEAAHWKELESKLLRFRMTHIRCDGE